MREKAMDILQKAYEEIDCMYFMTPSSNKDFDFLLIAATLLEDLLTKLEGE